ncbi:MAG TPA: hypothetical protein VGD97_02805 [Lacunisphaera sp.]
MRPKIYRQNGSVVLVVLCFVAVLSISLASYIALSSRAMTLSNRAAQNSLSKQLAEMGLEEALRAFNKNDWNDWTNGTAVDWTLSGTTATATITFPAGKFGQGVTGSVKIRVDNYNGAQLTSAWSASSNYRIGNLVGHTDGNWYRATANSLNKTPSTTNSNTTYWIQENNPISSSLAWTSGTSYSLGNMIQRNGTWYRCILANTASTSNAPPNVTYWTAVPYLSADADLYYVAESIVNYYGSWYRYTGSGWDGPLSASYTPTWSTTFYWRSTTSYTVGSVVWYNNIWYRCKTAHSNQVPTNTTYWDNASSLATTAAAAWAWSSSISYNLNDIVYYSSRWYRSTTQSNSNNTPSTSSAYWSAYPLLSRVWDSSRQYSQNDTVYYNGTWYRSLQNTNYNRIPSTQTSWWASAANASYQWNSTTTYAANSYQSYGGVWYKSLSSNTGRSPNNSTYWTAAWAQSSGVTSGATVAYAEGTINFPDSAPTKTQLRVVLNSAPLFPNAAAATTNLTLSAGGTVDSYDSTLGTYASQTPGFAAVLAATGTTNPAVTVTSATINGYVAAPSSTSSPFAPMWTYGGSAVVRGTSAGIGVDLTRVSRSPFVPSADILTVSNGSALSLADGTSYTLGTAGATTPTVYTISSATNAPNVALNNSTEVLTIVGPVILNISGNLNISLGKIAIASTGSAEIHLSGRFRVQNSTGGIENLTADPKKLIILGTSSLTTHVFQSTTYDFYGAIYLPNGSISVDFSPTIYGALLANNITFSSDANIHYDTSLRYITIPGVDQPYAPTEFRELTDSAELATMP